MDPANAIGSSLRGKTMEIHFLVLGSREIVRLMSRVISLGVKVLGFRETTMLSVHITW